MTAHLLDTNVLIALLDPDQTFASEVSAWFFSEPDRHWLTCPITENGAVRIISLPRYSRSQPPHVTVEALRTLMTFGRHEHVPDNVSLLSPDIDVRRLHGPGQVTDTYLALLTQQHGAVFATLDRRFSISALAHPVEVFQVPT